MFEIAGAGRARLIFPAKDLIARTEPRRPRRHRGSSGLASLPPTTDPPEAEQARAEQHQRGRLWNRCRRHCGEHDAGSRGLVRRGKGQREDRIIAGYSP